MVVVVELTGGPRGGGGGVSAGNFRALCCGVPGPVSMNTFLASIRCHLTRLSREKMDEKNETQVYKKYVLYCEQFSYKR